MKKKKQLNANKGISKSRIGAAEEVQKRGKSCGVQPTIFEVVKKETPDIAQEFGNVDIDSLIEAPNEAMVNKSLSEREKKENFILL